MIYADKYGHLIADSLSELHEFAERIGIKKHYYAGVRKRHPHYDLTNKMMLSRALANGAVLIGVRDIVKKSRRMK